MKKRNFRLFRLSSTKRREGRGYSPAGVVWCKPSLVFFEKKFFEFYFCLSVLSFAFFRVLGCLLSFCLISFHFFCVVLGCSFCRIFVFLRFVVCGIILVCFLCVVRMFFWCRRWWVLCVYVCKFCCMSCSFFYVFCC